jgi:hypothetical protein
MQENNVQDFSWPRIRLATHIQLHIPLGEKDEELIVDIDRRKNCDTEKKERGINKIYPATPHCQSD